MQRSLCAYLQDVTDAAEAIHDFTDGMQLESFWVDDLVRSAVERKFEIIGEALRQASQFFPGSVDSVPDLKDAVNQRNRIAHGYFDINPGVLWTTKDNDLAPLVAEIERLKKINHCV
jgi:uncharacterized protein with HEPN domain